MNATKWIVVITFVCAGLALVGPLNYVYQKETSTLSHVVPFPTVLEDGSTIYETNNSFPVGCRVRLESKPVDSKKWRLTGRITYYMSRGFKDEVIEAIEMEHNGTLLLEFELVCSSNWGDTTDYILEFLECESLRTFEWPPMLLVSSMSLPCHVPQHILDIMEPLSEK